MRWRGGAAVRRCGGAAVLRGSPRAPAGDCGGLRDGPRPPGSWRPAGQGNGAGAIRAGMSHPVRWGLSPLCPEAVRRCPGSRLDAVRKPSRDIREYFRFVQK
ncbi:hypothetical protein SCWH03_33670 [Streptomyces pacificus]|uniref:Uncharacterized protein n=1 Tax=Streptomyces pacificus TaxID=2705029 RepID=A0A6A0AXM5_9ACTN|nr:hypothetical protein SCWH03_33670 [Streptomyces pacificus]